MKNTKVNSRNRVALLTKKSKDFLGGFEASSMSGKLLSINKVTGYSLNFPIYPTCLPTKVCSSRCYFACGPATWPSSLQKQYSVYEYVKSNPHGAAVDLFEEISRKTKKPTFVRWNGGGDLFDESILMLDKVAESLPEIPFWVVTRIPEMAAKVKPRSNIFIHFSIDKDSLDRFKKARLNIRNPNLFFSYQVDKGETVDPEFLSQFAVIFFDSYDPGSSAELHHENICPLNLVDDISKTCESCRRCFNGKAVEYTKNLID